MDNQLLIEGVVTLQAAVIVGSMSLGLVFGYAAVSKALSMPSLIVAIRSYEIIPDGIAPVVGYILIVCESLIAIAHLADIGLRFVIPVAFALLLVFFLIIANILRSGEIRPCLCFGASRDDFVGIVSLVRIGLLLLIEGLLYSFMRTNEGGITDGAAILQDKVVPLAIAALIVTLVAWCMVLPELRRALRVVRS